MTSQVSASSDHSGVPPGKRPVFLVAGGVGPMAGVLLHERLVRHTTATTADRDHMDVVHFSLVSEMPDRTGFVSGAETRNPGPAMAEVLAPMAHALGEAGRTWHVVVPCATFHTPVMFDAFHAALREMPGFGRLYSLIDETAGFLRDHPAKPTRIGILSTKGSHAMGTWRVPLQAAGFETVELNTEDAVWMHDAIYHEEFGLKATFPPDPRAVSAVMEGCQKLADLGAQTVIMGCTELSIVGDEIRAGAPAVLLPVDPLTVLAQSCCSIGQVPV